MPAARADVLPWLIAGAMLVTPFPRAERCLFTAEADAIAAMGTRLAADRRAGWLPDSLAFWCRSGDASYTPTPAAGAWLRLRCQALVAVDLRMLEAMGRVVPVTLLLVTPDTDRGGCLTAPPRLPLGPHQ